MKETDTNKMDFREEAAPEQYSEAKDFLNRSLLKHGGHLTFTNAALAMLEFAQSHRSFDKGEVSEEEIEKASMSTFESADENDLRYGSWIMPFEAGVRWRESLSEQPESKPTESEQLEKLKDAVSELLRFKAEMRNVMSYALIYPDNFLKAM